MSEQKKSNEEVIADLKREHGGKGPIQETFLVCNTPVKATLGFVITDENGDVIVDRTIKEDDDG